DAIAWKRLEHTVPVRIRRQLDEWSVRRFGQEDVAALDRVEHGALREWPIDVDPRARLARPVRLRHLRRRDAVRVAAADGDHALAALQVVLPAQERGLVEPAPRRVPHLDRLIATHGWMLPRD